MGITRDFILFFRVITLLLVGVWSTSAPIYADTQPLKANIEEIVPHADSPFQQLYRLTVPTTADFIENIIWPDDWPQFSPQETLQLKIFHINDIHSKVVIPNIEKGDTRVMAQISARIRQAREENNRQAVLFLSAGDDHTGEVYDELLGYDANSFVKSLTYHAFSGAGLDVATLGNHEFDRGNEVLQQAIRQNAQFPVLSANIDRSDVLTSKDYAAAVIGTINGWRIAIFGLTSSADTKSQLADDPSFRLVPERIAIENFIPALSERVDIVIALSHIGYQQPGVFGDQQLAQWLAKLDIPAIVVGGHSHTLLHEKGYSSEHEHDGVPVFQAGSWGSHLGEVQLELTGTQLSIKRALLHPIVQHDTTYINDKNWVDETYEQQVISPVLKQIESLLNEQLAPAQKNPTLTKPRVLSQRYVGELAIANFMVDAIHQEFQKISSSELLLAAVNASSIVDGLPLHTPITFSDWHSVMPYADSIQRVTLTSEQLAALIQSNAKRIVRPEEQLELDLNGFINRGFLHFSGNLRYRIKLNEDPKQTQATDITLYGKPLSAYKGKILTLLVGDYIAVGNQGWRGQNLELWQSSIIQGFNMNTLPRTSTGEQFRDLVIKAMRSSTTDPLRHAQLDGRLQVFYN